MSVRKRIKKGGFGTEEDCIETKKVNTRQQLNSKNNISGETSSTSVGYCKRCFNILKYLILIVVIPPFLNYAALQKESRELVPEKGLLYDVGWGQKLFMMCHGQGEPTVILDAPTGLSSDAWSLLWPKIAKHTKVCIYDRAGLGFSERTYENRTIMSENGDESDTESSTRKSWQSYTIERMAEDFHKLFRVTSQQPVPFILVGAEISSLIVQFYTQMYESDVYGMVLVNPLSDDLFEQDGGVWTHYWFTQLLPTCQSLQMLAAAGLTRLGLKLGLVKHALLEDHIPEEVRNRYMHLLCHPKHLSSSVDELHFINDTFSQIRLARRLKSLPEKLSVTVITGNYYDEQIPGFLNKAWAKSEQNLISKYFPTASHIVINGGDRHMLYRNPSDVAEPILRMVRRWRSKANKVKL